MNELMPMTSDIIVQDEYGRLTMSEAVEAYLDKIQEAQDYIGSLDSDFRSRLLGEMLDKDYLNAKVGKYTISVVKGKDTVEFNVEKFIQEENEEIVYAFTELEEEKQFDVERFKKEHPEMYEAYMSVKTIPVVDTKKLEKTLPAIYNKYITVTPSTKKPTLRIAKGKAK